jgi:hypothetical protein
VVITVRHRTCNPLEDDLRTGSADRGRCTAAASDRLGVRGINPRQPGRRGKELVQVSINVNPARSDEI